MQFTELSRKYNERMAFVELNSVPELTPSFSRVITQATRDFYWNMYSMVKDNKLNYLDWLTHLRNFYCNEAVLALDPDDTLRTLGERLLNHKDILKYYQEEVHKNGQAFDIDQLLIMIKMMDRALAMDK